MPSLSDMLSSEITSLRAEAAPLIEKAAALMHKANALEAALQALASTPEQEVQPEVQQEVQQEVQPEVPPRAPHAWAAFYGRVCAILAAAGYSGGLRSVQPLWKHSHNWADEDILPAWLAFRAEAEAEAAAARAASARLLASEGGAVPAASVGGAVPAKPVKRVMTPEEKAARKAAKAAKGIERRLLDPLLDPFQHEGTEYLKNERGDVVSADGEWLGHWTGSAIDTTAPPPSDFDYLTTRD